MRKRRQITAHAPLPNILASLDQASWGDLRGREWHGVRAIIRGVCALVDYRTGVGAATAAQVADAAGYSAKSAYRYLPEAEAMGALTWTRGGVVAGRTVPGYFRVSKRWLLALAASGRVSLAEIRAKRAALRAARVAGLRFVMPGRRSRRSERVDITASLSPLSGESSTAPPRKEIHIAGDAGLPECDHGLPRKRMASGEYECPLCRQRERAELGVRA